MIFWWTSVRQITYKWEEGNFKSNGCRLVCYQKFSEGVGDEMITVLAAGMGVLC
jgi:hypothetical protein